MQDAPLSPLLNCSICSQELTPPTSILSICGHAVHKSCFENLPSSSVCCPSCGEFIYWASSKNKQPSFIHCSSCGLTGHDRYFKPLSLPSIHCACCGRLISGVFEDPSTDQIVTTINRLSRKLIQKNPEIETDFDLFKEHFFIEIVHQGKNDVLSLLLDHETDLESKEDLIFTVLKNYLSTSIKTCSVESLSQSLESNQQTAIITLLKNGIETVLNKQTEDQEIIEKGASAVEKLAKAVFQRHWTTPPSLIEEVFFEAVVQKEDSVISALLNKKIPPKTTHRGVSAFDKACQLQHITIVAKFLIAQLKNKIEAESYDPFHSKSSVLNLPLATHDLIETVIAKAPSINIKCLKKEMLFEAILQKEVLISNFLLLKGTSPNTIINGTSIFDTACELNTHPIIETLVYLKAQRLLKKEPRLRSGAKRISNDIKIILHGILSKHKIIDQKLLQKSLLFDSIVKNKLEVFSFILHSKIFSDATVPTGPLIQEACSRKRHSMVLELLKKWIEQTLKENPAQPAICENVSLCIEKIASKILGKNPNIDAVSLRKHILFSAIEQKDIFLVYTLLKGGAHPTSLVSSVSPLQKAYELNQHEIIVLLIRTWIERNLCEEEFQEKVKQAVSSAGFITQTILTQTKTFDIKSFLPKLMFGAVELGDELLVSVLLRGGILPTVVVNEQSILSKACDVNHQPIVMLLLKSILKKALEDVPDRTKVSDALRAIEVLVPDIFIKAGKIDCTSLVERLLFEAVIVGEETLVAGLLKIGGSPNATIDGESVMKKAYESKRENIISLLLKSLFF